MLLSIVVLMLLLLRIESQCTWEVTFLKDPQRPYGDTELKRVIKQLNYLVSFRFYIFYSNRNSVVIRFHSVDFYDVK